MPAENAEPDTPANPGVACPARARRSGAAHLVGGAIVVLFGGIYLSTLHPGVGRGDSAELQYIGAVLGVCHSPGYAVEVTFARLFSALPFGPSAAWRINLLMAVCGTIGCAALYFAMVRITNRIVPAVVSAGLLGGSAVFWANSVSAEVYVFYGMFLLLALYAAVRFVHGDRTRWLALAALFLGICVGDRISASLILPAFLALWVVHRKQVRLSVARVALSLVLLPLPFAYSLTFFSLRYDPDRIYARDDFARQRLVEHGPLLSELPPGPRLKYAARYCLGLLWLDQAAFSIDRMWWDLDKYAWRLGGLGGLVQRFKGTDPESLTKRLQQGRGADVGAMAWPLIALGLWRGRRRGWTWFGVLLFAGNLAFYLMHQPPDNLDFIIPGLIGLALLAGLGTSDLSDRTSGRGLRIAVPLLCLGAPLYLLVFNYRFVDRNTKAQRERVATCERLARAPLPPDSVIVTKRNSGMTYRYLYHVEASRSDIVVMNSDPSDWWLLIDHFNRLGRPVFLRSTPNNQPQIGPVVYPGEEIQPDIRDRCLRDTPPELAHFDFLRIRG